MTNEELQEIETRAREALTTTPQATALNMVLIEMSQEIQRLRAENAALREDMARIWDIGHDVLLADSTAALLRTIQSIKNIAARHTDDNAPAPEPAPATIKVGDKVRITKKSSAYHGSTGEVIRVPSVEWHTYVVRFVVDGFPLVQNEVEYYRDEIEPA